MRGDPLRVAGAAALLAAGLLMPGALEGQSWSTAQYERQLGGAEAIRVHVEYGAGVFTVGPADRNVLYRARIRYDEDAFSPVHDFSGGTLRVGVQGSSSLRGSMRRGEQEGELDLLLSPAVPMHLEMEFGAVRADLDLGGLRLEELSLSTGASDTRVRVSQRNPGELGQARFKVGAASFQASDLGRLNAREIDVEAGVGDVRLDLSGLHRSRTRVSAKMGLGSLEIRIPSEAGIRLTRSTFLTSLNAPGLERDGNEFRSPGWSQAPMQVEIRVESAIGSITILRDG